jgi:hypothetical protein
MQHPSPVRHRPRVALPAAIGSAAAFLCACAAAPKAQPPAPGAHEPVAASPAAEGGAATAAATADSNAGVPQGTNSGASLAADEGSATPAQAGGAEPKPDADELAIHGSLSSRYRARTSGGAHDQDFYETLVLDIGDSRKDGVTAHLMGRLAGDLDGQSDRDGQYVYPNLADAWSDPLQGLLYEAWVDVHDAPKLSALRIGRQSEFQTPVFAYFDGISLATNSAGAWNWRGGAYGGVPVRLYEQSATGDELFGLWGEAKPWAGGRVRLDWMHIEDKDRFGANENDLLGASLTQRLDERSRLDVNYTRLEETDRDVRLRGTWADPELDLSVQASWYRLLEVQTSFALEFDPFFESLQDFEPYDQFRLQASKGLGERYRLDGGLDLRRLDEGSAEGSFNRDYDRGWLSLVLLDLARVKGLTLTLTGDVWSSSDQDVETWGADLSRKFDNGLTLSGGSNYALYRYDFFLNRERDDVRSWYLRMRKKLGDSWSLEGAYDFQDDSEDSYHVLTLGAVWRF